MCEIIIKIDAQNGVTIRSDGIQDHQDSEPIQAEVPVKQKAREIHSFMLYGDQYCRANDIYWIISQYKIVSGITKNRYYDRRKEAGYDKS